MAALRSVCPRCRRTYGSEVRVCKADGTMLVDEERLASAEERRARDATFRGPPGAAPGGAAPPAPTRRTTPPSPPTAGRPTPLPSRPTQLPTQPLAAAPQSGGTLPPHLPHEDPHHPHPGFERLGPYRLLRQLGEGGMARIYLAEHEKLGRICAIKRLHADHFADRLTVARFLAEARAVGAIHHPNLVAAYDVVEEPNEIYLVMEYLDGRDVAQVLRDEGPMSPERAAEVMAQACDGLAAVHGHNIIHRDLKPENIFLTRLPDGGERVKLLDFGVARLLGDRPQELKTRSGLTVGTPTYMSPEQATASDIDARSDIYTVGVVLYEMITGAPPFTGAGYGDVMLMHVNDPPPKLSTRRPDVPGWIEDIVMRCLEKEPSARYESATELAAALRAAGRKNSAPVSKETRRVPHLVTGKMPVVAKAPWPRWVWAAGAGGMLAIAASVAFVVGWRRGPAVKPAAVTVAAATPATPPVRRTVRVTSEPEGAQVIVAGVERCTTPCDALVPETTENVLVTVKAEHYLPEQRMVDGASPPDAIQIKLQPIAPPPAPAPPQAPVVVAPAHAPVQAPVHVAAPIAAPAWRHRRRHEQHEAREPKKHGASTAAPATNPAGGRTVDPFAP